MSEEKHSKSEKKRTSSSECVKVVVRCRPLSEKETSRGYQRVIDMDPKVGVVRVRNPRAAEDVKEFTYDCCYDWNSEQAQVYEDTAFPIVESVMEGYNGTIFAYGQTGTGKTFTMVGAEGHLQGLIPRAFAHIYKCIDTTPERRFLVRVSFLEIYNEEVRDLLGKNPKEKLELKDHPEKGVYVKGLSDCSVTSVEDMDKIMQIGHRNRSVASTQMNSESSRSHSLFSIVVESYTEVPGSKPQIRVGKLNLVDLAGSERQSKTGATGEQLKEATKINLSLSALGNVISALVDGKHNHVPYRDSKLTRLLQDSLGGNTKTVMVANIGPAEYNYDESLSTLRYAHRAKQIKNRPRINEDPKDTLIRQFQEEIENLRKQLTGGSAGGVAGVAGVNKEEVDKMIQLERDQMHLEFEEARTKITQDKEKSEAEKKKLMEEIQKKEDEAERQRKHNEEMRKRLSDLEKQVVQGTEGAMADKARHEKELRKAKEELEKKRRKEAELEAVREREAKERMALEKQCSSKEDLVQKLMSKLEKAQGRVKELEEEQALFRDERVQMYEAYKERERDANLRELLIQAFIPESEVSRIMQRVRFDEQTDSWVLLNAHMSGNALRNARPKSVYPSALHPTSAAAALESDENPLLRPVDQRPSVDLDMPESTSHSFAEALNMYPHSLPEGVRSGLEVVFQKPVDLPNTTPNPYLSYQPDGSLKPAVLSAHNNNTNNSSKNSNNNNKRTTLNSY